MKLTNTCTRCTLCKTRANIVWGNGPEPCPIMFIGEAPGTLEDRFGYPFVDRAPAGAEFNALLSRIGLMRESVYVTNCVKCHPPKDRDPTPDEMSACSIWLDEEIRRVQPQYIVTLGATSTHLYLPDASMDHEHGIPRVLDTGQVLFPVYHPAAGLHRPETMTMVQQDFAALRDLLRGAIPPRHTIDPYPNPDYAEITSPDDPYLQDFIHRHTIVATDTEWCRGLPWCLSFSTSPGTARVVMADQPRIISILHSRMADPSVLTIGHNLLYDLPVLERMGIRPYQIADTIDMAYLLQDLAQSLKTLAYRLCGINMVDYSEMVAPATFANAMVYLLSASVLSLPDPKPIPIWDSKQQRQRLKKPRNIIKKIAAILKDVDRKHADPWDRWHNINITEGRGQIEALCGFMIRGDLSDLDHAEAVKYSARDADATLRVYNRLWPRILENGLSEAFWIDMGAMQMVSDMMVAGIEADPEHFRKLSAYLEEQKDGVLVELLSALGRCGITLDNFNPASPPQVAKVLYDRSMLNLSKYAGRDRSTGDEILARLLESRVQMGDDAATVVSLVRDWREYDKLKGTYSDPMPQYCDHNNRVHTSFRYTRTTTGRLSSSEPNLMAFPVRSEDGRRLRDGFVAKDGCVITSCDYSQIELRVLAHESGDSNMIQIFRDGLDIHAQTASRIFGIPVDQLDDMQHRRPAKTVNFGIVYGMGAEGLQGNLATLGLKWTLRKCEDLIEGYFATFPGVKLYMADLHAHARRHGYVVAMAGRIRRTPLVRSPNRSLVAGALREAGNFPIQGGAQVVIKKAMGELVPIYREWRGMGYEWNPLLQIHDDLVNEIQEDVVETILPIIVYTMENAVKLSAPLRVDAKMGRRWGSMEKWPPKEEK